MLTGSGDAVWKVLSVDDDRMEIDYYSGEIDVDGAAVRRKNIVYLRLVPWHRPFFYTRFCGKTCNCDNLSLFLPH